MDEEFDTDFESYDVNSELFFPSCLKYLNIFLKSTCLGLFIFAWNIFGD